MFRKIFTKLNFAIIFYLISLFLGSLIFNNKQEKNVKIFDYKTSIFLQDPKDHSYTKFDLVKSKYLDIEIVRILKPVFIHQQKNQKTILSANCEPIEVFNPEIENQLVILTTSNLSTVPEIYKLFKDFRLVSMNFINNRRWQVVILKGNKMITIDFPSGIPDVENFKKMDNQYNLTSKYDNLDLRFMNKIGVKNNEKSN